ALSDTIIVASIDPVGKTVGMMSIPRDTLVPIPGVGNDKINAAFSNGQLSSITGPGLVQATIEYDFHIPIQYYALVDFAGFEKIVNTLGGVTVDVPAPLKDDQYPGQAFNYTRIYYSTGLQHMNGVEALDYVRTRHDDNDFARGNRQRQVLVALRQQGVKLDLLPKAPQLLSEFGNTVQTDIPPTDLLRLATLATKIHSGSIKSYSLLPALTEQWSPGQPYYLIPDWAKVQQIVDQMIPPTPTTPATPAASTPVVERPDLGAAVMVENGTFVNKLAAHSATKLQSAGFSNVSTAEAQNAGQYPTSQVISYSPNLATARLVAQTLGLPGSAVVTGDPAKANGYAVVAILGNDAPNTNTLASP
ncbi:MAG TPA: LCP family protein, partial [Thermomicrobiaceae bacterium]|nr:LCP family protein [Thermomicrobiaceae bacterium]